MAIEMLDNLGSFIGGKEVPSLRINCLIQVRIPGLKCPVNKPDFTPRLVTNFPDVVKQYEPALQISLINQDNEEIDHQISYEWNERQGIEGFFEQFTLKHLGTNLKKVAGDNADTYNLLWEDKLRIAVLDTAIINCSNNPNLSIDNEFLPNFTDTIAFPTSGESSYNITSTKEVKILPTAHQCSPEAITQIEEDRTKTLIYQDKNHTTVLDLDEKIKYLPWVKKIAADTLERCIQGYLAKATIGERNTTNLINHITHEIKQIRQRFDENIRKLINAQQTIERSLREVDGFFRELKEKSEALNKKEEHHVNAFVYLVNAHMFKTSNNEDFIAQGDEAADGNPTLFRGYFQHMTNGGLSTVAFDNVEEVNEQVALMVVTDRVRGSRDVNYLAKAADKIRMVVFANVHSPALAGEEELQPADLARNLQNTFANAGGHDGLRRVALFGTDLVVQAEQPNPSSKINTPPITINTPPITIRPAALAAGQLLALGLIAEITPDLRYINHIIGFPPGLKNQASLRGTIPVNTVRSINDSKTGVQYQFSGFKSLDEQGSSIVYSAIVDAIARHVRWALLQRDRTAGDQDAVRKSAEFLNKKLMKLTHNLPENALLKSASIDTKNCAFIPATRTQNLPLLVEMSQVTEHFRVEIKVSSPS